MADIDVVKKPSRTWVWVLVVLAVLVVLWLVLGTGTRQPNQVGLLELTPAGAVTTLAAAS